MSSNYNLFDDALSAAPLLALHSPLDRTILSTGHPILMHPSTPKLRPTRVAARSPSTESAAAYASNEVAGEVFSAVQASYVYLDARGPERRWKERLRSRRLLRTAPRSASASSAGTDLSAASDTEASAVPSMSAAAGQVPVVHVSEDEPIALGDLARNPLKRSRRVKNREIVGHGNKNRVLHEKIQRAKGLGRNPMLSDSFYEL